MLVDIIKMSDPGHLNPRTAEDTDNSVDTLGTGILDRAVNATIETNILNPISHQYDYQTGGRTIFQFPSSGVLDAPNASITFNPTSADDKAMFPFYAGGLAMIDRATVRVGGVILSQITNVGEYATLKNQHNALGYQSSVLDVRHGSSNCFQQYVRPDVKVDEVNTSAIYNVEADQPSSWHEATPALTNTAQPAKKLAQAKKETIECVVRLADIFPFFKDNKLPLMAMAQVEIHLEWLPAGAIADNVNSCVTNADQASATTGVITLDSDQVRMNCDYIHYDDEEKAKIMNSVNQGMNLRFTEVVVTKGINPEAGAAGDSVQSNHIIGMAGKEVQAIYVKKLFDVNSTKGDSEKGELGHNNAFLNQFRSQNIRREKYNWIINNFRVYSQDVQNTAEQHQYISMIQPSYQPVPASYNTMNYEAGFKEILLASDQDGGACKSQEAFLGTAHCIGLNLKKFADMGAAFQNATRIGTSPIEFSYTREGATNNLAQVDLTFFIEYSRTLTITPLGVNVTDS